MSSKRSRKEFEADLQAQQSPYVIFGTPLPPVDPNIRDDGSFVPVWQQDVRDDHGRRRLHGAFTGGFSAGYGRPVHPEYRGLRETDADRLIDRYHNTVGSKEGWTPATFVSSRSNRHQDQPKSQQELREQYMDDEDLADASEKQTLQTTNAFSGLGGDPSKSTAHKGGLMDLFKQQADNAGLRLMRKMGWKDRQGLGPMVSRKVDLSGSGKAESHLFAPKDTKVTTIERVNKKEGLGYAPQETMEPASRAGQTQGSDDEDDPRKLSASQLLGTTRKVKPSLRPRGGIGVGILNDDGDDDEDPYALGPAISLKKIHGGNRKQNKKLGESKPATGTTTSLLKSRPALRPKGLLQGTKTTIRKGHDGRPALRGFVLSQPIEERNDSTRRPLPKIPEGWESSKKKTTDPDTPNNPYTSTTDAAKQSKLDPAARSRLLGEEILPGKSVFSFLSSAARDKIAQATGRTDLPPALNEAIASHPKQTARTLDPTLIPPLLKATALAALSRSSGGWVPYADDDAKRARYQAFLEYHAGQRADIPPRPAELRDLDAHLAELREFAKAAEVFKPVSGAMASRFVSASSAPATLDPSAGGAALLSTPASRSLPEDPAETAARMRMFGPLTRSVGRFTPTRLLCKRFGVRPPEHAVAEAREPVVSEMEGGLGPASAAQRPAESAWSAPRLAIGGGRVPAKVDLERNDALEGGRASDDVLRGIYGDGGN